MQPRRPPLSLKPTSSAVVLGSATLHDWFPRSRPLFVSSRAATSVLRLEALAVRLLTTVSGVGFALGLVYPLVRNGNSRLDCEIEMYRIVIDKQLLLVCLPPAHCCSSVIVRRGCLQLQQPLHATRQYQHLLGQLHSTVQEHSDRHQHLTCQHTRLTVSHVLCDVVHV